MDKQMIISIGRQCGSGSYPIGRTWSGYDPHHLMIDSSLLGPEGTAELIISIAGKKFGL